jgi:adenylate cyclase
MSDRNRRFLRFIVEEKLAGRAERIKSYAIAVDVFGRAPTFDSITDPIVRIEATRMRAALANYYRQYADEGIRIDIPKGSYIPSFERAVPNPVPEAARPPSIENLVPADKLKLVGVALCAVAACAAFLMLRAFPEASHADPLVETPMLAVEAVQNIGTGPGGDELARGLTQSIISSLSRFPGVRLLHFQEGRASAGDGTSNDATPAYVLQSNLRTGSESLRFWWQLKDARTGETLWSENVDQPEAGNISYTIEDRISAYVASRIAEPYGLIGTDVSTHSEAPMPGYRCVLMARAQQAAPDPQRQRQIRKCLEETIAFAPHYSDAWALLALTYLQEERPWRKTGASGPDLPRGALEAAERAAQLSPQSGLAHLALLASHFRLGNFTAAREDENRALKLNPNDPEILHAAGLRAYIRGRREEGLAYIEKARALISRNRPGAQFILALDAYRSGDYARAGKLLHAISGSDNPLIGLLCAASHAMEGSDEEARESIQGLLRTHVNYGGRLKSDLAALHFDTELQTLIIDAARVAGLRVP